MNGRKMEECVGRGQLSGWGSPGRWWQIKQKRPCAPAHPALSPSPLKPIMERGRLKWVATVKCIIFEMLSHKPPPPPMHIQLSRALSASLLCQPPFCVSNCLPPASEMSCQTWKGLSFACHGSDRLGVTTLRKKRNREKQWIEAGRTGAVSIVRKGGFTLPWPLTSFCSLNLLKIRKKLIHLQIFKFYVCMDVSTVIPIKAPAD